MGAVIASTTEDCWEIPTTCITSGGNGGLPCPEIIHFQEGPSGNTAQTPPGVGGFCVAPGVVQDTLPPCALAAAPQASPAICSGSVCCHPNKQQLIPRCPFSLGSAYFTTTGTKKVGLLSGAGAGAMPWPLEADKPNIAYEAAHNITSRQPPVTLDI